MKLFSILFLFILLCVSVIGFTKLETLSTIEKVELLKLMDTIKNTENNTKLKIYFQQLTDLEYDESLRSKIYDLIDADTNHTSVFVRLAGFITFKNIFLTCLVIACVVLAISLFKDIFIILGAYVGFFIIQVILDKRLLYTVGFGFSCFLMYFNPSTIENQYIKYLFILDWLTPLFGCFIFAVIAFVMYNDFVERTVTTVNGVSKEHTFMPLFCIVTVVWSIVTIYHQNYIIGIFTIMMMYFTFGFVFGTMFGGYYTGFINTPSMLRCFVVSVIFNALTIGLKIGFFDKDIMEYVDVFQTGMRFFGTFVGCLSMLIMSDESFILTMNNYKRDKILPYFMIMQLAMAVYSLGLMFFGNIYDLTTFKSIGGTFFVLWGLDLETSILRKMGRGHFTIAIAIIIANMYAVYQWMCWYPEYFIFAWH